MFTRPYVRTSALSRCGGAESPEVTEMKYWNGC